MVLTNKNKFNLKYGFPREAPHSKAELAKITGVPIRILNEVYDRGLAAHKNNPQSVRSAKTGKKIGGKSLRGKMSAQQWAQARVYSFLVGGRTQKSSDRDLAKKAGLI